LATWQDLPTLSRLLDGEGWPPVDAWELAVALLDNLGSPDPRLRDELSLTLLWRLVDEDRLAPSQQEALLRLATDADHLFSAIGSQGDDTVFRRTFSVLVVPMVVGADSERLRLTPAAVEASRMAVMAYARGERDWRGYVPGKGWAHAVAHTADALGALGLHPHTPPTDAVALLTTIHDLATVPYPLGYLEDDRLAFAAWRLMQSGRVPDESLEHWLDGFQLLDDRDDQGATLGGANALHFLRGLYFRLKAQDPGHGWLGRVAEAANRFDIFLLREGKAVGEAT
jgi:hypothetical protein